jgi:AraC family transcriptional regulator of adaptative response / methylphosphotriester-DNA alkyltransferase methyltransferase
LFKAAQALLDEDPAGDVSLASMALRLAASPRQLERAFAEAGETTFRAEVTAARIRRAAALLGDPGMTIAEVANAVGYRQAPHFAKAFRAAHGKSPAEWRLSVHGYGRPTEVDRDRRKVIEERQAYDAEVRKWATERVEAAEREGRTAWRLHAADDQH